MSFHFEQRPHVKKDFISNETRTLVHKLVLEEGNSIIKVSKMLKMNYSTCKNLVNNFKKTGRIHRVREQTKQKEIETQEFREKVQ